MARNSNTEQQQDFDFFKEKQLNSKEHPSFIALGLYTIGKAINKKNMLLAFWLACGTIAVHGGVDSFTTWQKNRTANQTQELNMAQDKINEKFALIKAIPKEDLQATLDYMDKVANVATQFQQETFYYIDYYTKKDIINSRNSGYFNQKNMEAGIDFTTHIQNRKETVARTYDQVIKGMTKSLPVTPDKADPADLVVTWHGMHKQNSAYVPESFTEVRKSLFQYSNTNMIEAQAYVAEKMKGDKTTSKIKIN